MHRHPAGEPTARTPLAVGSDHAAYLAKERLLAWLRARGIPVSDQGAFSAERVDYPVFGRLVAQGVAEGRFARGLLLCGTGIGISIAANRIPGVRAALCWSRETARLSRDHNDANVLVLPGHVPSQDPLENILAAWLETPYSGEPRHSRRLDMLDGP